MKDEKKPKFEDQTRVVAYTGETSFTGHVDRYYPRSNSYGFISDKGTDMHFHEKQLRRLVKKKRRGWWMLQKYEARSLITNEAMNAYICTTKPSDPTGWIYVEERKPR